MCNIDNNTDYLIIPQKRLQDGNLTNNILLSEDLDKK